MSRITNLQQVLSQTTQVEKVQQVQQIQGDVENARLAAQAQKQTRGKKRKVQDAVPSDPVEFHGKKDDEDRDRRKRDSREEAETEKDNPARTNHIDIRA